VASSPALRGSWVYDDRLMLGHPMLDGLEDVIPAFGRTSDAYQARTRSGPAIAGGSTYRPLAMVSFIVVNATVGPRPLAHHLVSLLCHLGAVWLLLRHAGRLGWRALLVVTIFALHPAQLEGYGWINARADVLAGLALAALLAVRRWPALVLVLLAGGLAKETFFIAAAALLVATGRPRALGGLALAAAVVIVLRHLAGGTSAGVDPALAARLPRLVGLAVETWIAPWPHAMRLLAWETTRPVELGRAAACAVPVLALVLLVARRQLGRAVLVLGALATLAPAVLVSDAFWLGFDRYLYLPAVLCAAAALPLAGGGRFSAAATLLAALALGAATFVAAGAYTSHTAFTTAVLRDRPDEPTGALVAADDALERGRPDEAAALVEAMPTWDLPPSVAHHAASLLLALGRQRDAAALVERAAAAAPDNANLAFDLFTVRAAQGRWPDVIALARRLGANPARRRAVLDAVDAWTRAGQIPPDVRLELLGAVNGHHE
jgi:hypothetical protein